MSLFRDKTDWNNIEFVYCEFHPARSSWAPGCLGIFQWGAKNIGFGEVTMFQFDEHKESGVEFDTENMSHDFLAQLLAYWARHSVIR